VVAVCGEALMDVIHGPNGKRVERPGGGPFNTARALARLSVPAAFLGASHLTSAVPSWRGCSKPSPRFRALAPAPTHRGSGRWSRRNFVSPGLGTVAIDVTG